MELPLGLVSMATVAHPEAPPGDKWQASMSPLYAESTKSVEPRWAKVDGKLLVTARGVSDLKEMLPTVPGVPAKTL